MALGSNQPLTEMITRSISWGQRRPVRKTDKLPPSCAAVTKSGSPNFLEPSWATPGLLDNKAIIEFCTQIIRLSGLKHGLCSPYCESRTLLRMRLTVGVCRLLRCVRLAVGYVEGFVLCLRARRGG